MSAMYAQFFGLKQAPFSIAPDPRYLFMSERHREALAHLLYGLRGGGGFVLLSGEIGAGKTTVCRCFLEQIPKRCNVAYIFNPKLTVPELLKSICDEFHIPYQHQGPGTPTVKDCLDPLNEFLLKTHAVGQNNVLIIDEAQNLSADVLEQLRLLTNLETNERKLLQIILIGQPELRGMLARPELEQLAQRVIARFHLEALSESEAVQYIRHRLAVAGLTSALPFDRAALRRIHQLSRGVPRRINLLCDRALLGAYASGKPVVDRRIVDKAAAEVFDQGTEAARRRGGTAGRLALVGGGLVAGAALFAAVGRAVDGHLRPPVAQAAPAVAKAPAAAASLPVPPPPSAAASAPGPVALWRSDKDAWRELAPLWQVTLPEGDACAAAARQQLQCFRGSGGLGLIRQLGRPGILTLQDEAGRPAYALLTGLTQQGAVLRMAGGSRTVPLSQLASLWRGDFATFWRAPEGYSSQLGPGESGPAVDWLAGRLATLQHQPAPPPGTPFDAALKQRLQAFQLAQGLKPDGRPGPVTFMQLNRAADVAEPRLPAEL